ncbi:extracellular solute-binding protein [Paenibacillus sp. MMS20-IR301]|uniref:extracellular solute-binding protein n=1 Tax=Paenibacillus sp. MMS20-IR301 TaxID=2895946 RepID=UPI0028EFAAB4|nr:extracellular solute-binding protein [Paenibacillus sp. MMS20-IR301]WNS41712.1 extracellular solute-binding protein [Paenibacillus sp. MMS20-IR301]
MKTNKLKVTMTAAMASLLLLTTACSSGNSGSGANAEGKEEVTITFRSSGSEDTLTKYFESGLIDKFESENPDIKINIAPVLASEGDYTSKIVLQMKSPDTAPDIVAEDTSIIKSDAAAGYLEPLDTQVAGWSDWQDKFIANLKSGVTGEDGKIYGIPATSDTRGIWYNKELLAEAGIAVPFQPASWEEVLEAARTIKDKLPGVTPLNMIVGKSSGEGVTMQTLEMLLYGTNDTLYNNDTKKWVVSSAGLLDSFKFINQVFNVDKTGPTMQVALNGQAGSIAFQQLFPQGKLAMAVDGSWAGSTWFENGAAPIENVADKMGFAPFPTQNGQEPGAITMSGGWAWSIPAEAQNKEAAWKFLEFLMNQENATARVVAEGNLSPRSDSVDVAGYTDRTFVAEAQALLEVAQFRPANDEYATVSAQLQSLVESVASGKLAPEAAVQQLNDNVTRSLGEDKVEVK